MEDLNSPLSLLSDDEISQSNLFYQIFNPNIQSSDTKNYTNYDKIYFINGKEENNAQETISSSFQYKKFLNTKTKSSDEFFFPFTPKRGLLNGLTIESINSEPKNNINSDNLCIDFKFKTKKYHINSNGRKIKERKKRKFKSDDIRKKIKSRFHKTLKDNINESLKKAGSEKLFDFLPHYFVKNITKQFNEKYFKLTYKELLMTNFTNEIYTDNSISKKADLKRFLNNQEVLQYLAQNEAIEKKSGFDLIKDKKYKELMEIYFSSLEFEQSLIRLKEENEDIDYIIEYIYIARHYIDFFCGGTFS